MKGIVILAVVLGLIGAGIWMAVVKTSMSDQGQIFLVVIGNSSDKGIEFDVSVELGMAHMANPPLDERGEPDWDKWINSRFEMKDAAGNRAPHARVAHTMLIDENKVKHIPEFYVQYQLQQGKDYMLDYIPASSDVRYRYKFNAETLAPTRETFVPVKE